MAVPIPIYPRVTSGMTANIVTSNIGRNGSRLFRVQKQLSTGQQIPAPSFDPAGANLTMDLQSFLEKKAQQSKNMTSAESVMAFSDDALSQIDALLIDARSTALGEVGDPATPETRLAAATAITGIMDQLMALASSKFGGRYVFSGTETEQLPFVEEIGGLIYQGNLEDLTVNTGFDSTLAMNVTGDDAFGAWSDEVGGTVDLDPAVDADTRLSWLNNGDGAAAGSISIDDGTGNTFVVDLSDASTLGDVMDLVNDAGRGVVTAAIGPGGNNLVVASGAGDPIVSEYGGGTTAAELGILGAAPAGSGQVSGADLDPVLTDLTKIANLNGGAGLVLGEVLVNNGTATATVDLSGAQTLQDVKKLLEGSGTYIEVGYNEDGRSLSVKSRVSGVELSIGEAAAGDTTATDLGIRTMTGTTLVSRMNRGWGINTTGDNDPSYAAADDIEITTTAPATTFGVNLDGVQTVQDVLDAINTASTAEGLGNIASLNQVGNGIRIDVGGGNYTVTSINGTTAAENLGIEQTAPVASGQDGQDVAGVQVAGVFTSLMNLREALLSDSDIGIQNSLNTLNDDIDRILESRGKLGARMSRVRLLNERVDIEVAEAKTLLSETFDLDYTAAITEFENAQAVFEASIRTAVQLLNVSILDFL